MRAHPIRQGDASKVGKIIANVVMHTNLQDDVAKNAYPLLQSLFGELLKMNGDGATESQP